MGHVTNLEGALALDDTDYKNTPKLTWLAKVKSAAMTPTVMVHFDHLITKGVLKPDEDFKDFVNRDSMVRETDRCAGETTLGGAKATLLDVRGAMRASQSVCVCNLAVIIGGDVNYIYFMLPSQNVVLEDC